MINRYLPRYDVLGVYDLAEITHSPDRIYQILNLHRVDQFAPTQRIVFYSQHTPSIELLQHIKQAAQLIDIDNSFILLCCSSDISNLINSVFHNENIPETVVVDITSSPLGNTFKLHNDTMCPIPWINVELTNTGNIRPCCLNTDIIGNVSTGIDTAFYSDRANQLRKDLLEGRKPKGCSNCWIKEDNGFVTNRIRHNNYLLKDLLINGLDKPKIQTIDLKMGLTCNFKCRICGSRSSSLYAEEEAKFKGIPFVIEKNWSDVPEYLDDIINLLPSINNIDMYGGEPWLVKSFKRVLTAAVDGDYAKHIRLHYNTNGSIYPADLIPYWSEFKEVDIHFSIDALGDRFSLQRGSNWSTVENNIVQIKNLNFSNLKIRVMPAISIMNIFYLDQVLAWANSHNFPINPQHVIWPKGYALDQLTKEAKELIVEKFKNHAWPEMQNIVNHIQQLPDSNGEEFVKLTRHFDLLRNENFAESHPEIAKAMGYVYNQ